MKNFISKSVTVSLIESEQLVTNKDGTHSLHSLKPITVLGRYDLDNAYKAVRKIYKGKNFIVTNVNTTTEKYIIPIDVFLKYAVIENKKVEEIK